MKKGFSLVEILVVLGIISIIMVLSIQGMGYFKDKQKVEETKLRLLAIQTALESYHSLYDEYPESDEVLKGGELLYQELYAKPVANGDRPFMPQFDKSSSRAGGYVIELKGRLHAADPWGKPLIYEYPGRDGEDTYDLGSLGADGIESKDDLNNWLTD